MVVALKADASLLLHEDCSPFGVEGVSGHDMGRVCGKSLAMLVCPLSMIQVYGRWDGATVLSYVEEAKEEPADIRCFEPTCGELKVQRAVAVDVLKQASRVPAVAVKAPVIGGMAPKQFDM